jgi:hypothetical protein
MREAILISVVHHSAPVTTVFSDLEELAMPDLESPICALDLRDPSTCVNIAMAKPGEEIRVMVRVEDNSTATQLMEAIGTLSNAGKSFSLVVTREDGTQQTQDLCYRDLLKVLSDLG